MISIGSARLETLSLTGSHVCFLVSIQEIRGETESAISYSVLVRVYPMRLAIRMPMALLQPHQLRGPT